MKKIELIGLVNFVGMPDEWRQADGKDDELQTVYWDQLAQKKLVQLKRNLPKMKGSELDFVETEARRFLNEPRSENFPYLHRHRQMYLPHVLSLIKAEINRRGAVLNPLESKEKANKRPQPQWHRSRRDTVDRRHIVLNNSGRSAKDLCGYFDTERIGLPEGWEKRFNVSTWKEAYKDQKARSNIHRIISTDRRK